MPPGTQIKLIMELVVTIFIPAIDADHVFSFHQTGIYDPVCVLQCNVRKPTALGYQRTMLSGSCLVQTNLRCDHWF